MRHFPRNTLCSRGAAAAPEINSNTSSNWRRVGMVWQLYGRNQRRGKSLARPPGLRPLRYRMPRYGAVLLVVLKGRLLAVLPRDQTNLKVLIASHGHEKNRDVGKQVARCNLPS